MSLFGTFISVAILWFLITLFTRSTSSSRSLTESWIVVIGMLIVDLLIKFTIGKILGLFALILNIVVLYFLVDKVCGTSKQVTIRICVWYFGLTNLINLFLYLIAS